MDDPTERGPTSRRVLERIAKVKTLIEELRTAHITHRNYIDLRNRAYHHAALATPGRVILIVGPSRSGKSKIGKWIAEELVSEERDPRYEPLIGVEISSTVSAQYAIRNTTARLLREVRHPFYGDMPWDTPEGPSVSEDKLLQALDDAIVLRKTAWVFLDELHHLVRTHNHRLAAANMDALKGMVSPGLKEAKKTCLVGIGGYNTLRDGLRSSHFNNRMLLLHMRRYRLDDKDSAIFNGALAMLDTKLPLAPSGFSLLKHRAFIYAGTFGVWGQVMEWTFAALAEMAASGKDHLEIEHFEATKSLIQLPETLEDIEAGEAMVQSIAAEGFVVDDIETLHQKIRSLIVVPHTSRPPRSTKSAKRHSPAGRKPFSRSKRRLRIGK